MDGKHIHSNLQTCSDTLNKSKATQHKYRAKLLCARGRVCHMICVHVRAPTAFRPTVDPPTSTVGRRLRPTVDPPPQLLDEMSSTRGRAQKDLGVRAHVRINSATKHTLSFHRFLGQKGLYTAELLLRLLSLLLFYLTRQWLLAPSILDRYYPFPFPGMVLL